MIRKEVEKTGRVHHFKIGETAQKSSKNIEIILIILGNFFSCNYRKNYFKIDPEGKRKAIQPKRSLQFISSKIR